MLHPPGETPACRQAGTRALLEINPPGTCLRAATHRQVAGRGAAERLERGWPFATIPAPLLSPSAHPPDASEDSRSPQASESLVSEGRLAGSR